MNKSVIVELQGINQQTLLLLNKLMKLISNIEKWAKNTNLNTSTPEGPEVKFHFPCENQLRHFP